VRIIRLVSSLADIADKEWNKLKTELFAFLVPSSKIIDILLHEHGQIKSIPATDLCIQMIATLAGFASITQQSEGGLEGHDRVLFGALDILVAKAGSKGVQRLFRTIIQEEISGSRAAFVSRCGELVVDEMDSSTLAQDLLPLSQS
jgi:hypothetical protein